MSANPGPDAPGRSPLNRRDPSVRLIIRRWRRLTGCPSSRRAGPGAPTIVACSGGADSAALLLALAAATDELTVAHVLHDIRPRQEAAADRDAVAALADRLRLPFVEAEVRVRGRPGNVESIARRLRYEQLARVARDRGVPFVATAHHGDDQLETLLMALLRGAGPRGLRGIAPRRRLTTPGETAPVTLIRPMLALGRADAECLCTLAGYTWRHDTTNLDTTRLRAALRHGVIDDLRRLRPGLEQRVDRSTTLLRDLVALLDDETQRLLAAATVDGDDRGEPRAYSWPRGQLAGGRSVVVGEALRAAIRRLAGDRGMDRIGYRALRPILAVIADDSTEPRRFDLRAVRIEVTAHAVTASKTGR